MKFVSKAALAGVILLGAPTLPVVAPATAQQAAQIKVSQNFRKGAALVESAIQAKNWAAAKAQLDVLKPTASGEDEKYYIEVFTLQVAVGLNDNAAMVPALDALIANPKTPQADLGRYNFFRGDFADKAKQYAQAVTYYQRARDLGYAPNGANLNLLIAQAQIRGGQVAPGVAAIDAAIKAEEAAGRKAPEAWYKFAASALYTSGNKAGAAQWLSRQVAAHPSADAWRSSLLVFVEQAGTGGATLDADERLDILRLMRATGAMAGESDYYQYAEAAQRRGLPWEARAVIDEGRASGKVSKPNPRLDPIYTQATGREKAEVPLAQEEKRAAAAANGTVAMATGDAYLASRNLPKAIELYRLALQKGSVDANLVNTRLGIALALAGQKAEAKTALGAVNGGTRGEIARFWLAWVDQAA